MHLTIHRGSREIGGSCLEVATKNSRVILDVGLPLVNAQREPFDRRSLHGKSIPALLAEGVLPAVPGLFDDGSPPDGILLSHAHLDHSGMLPFARREVPCYATVGTAKMMLAGSLFAGQPRFDRTHHRIVEPDRPFTIGDFHITAYAVDHSTFGSVAYVIEADDRRVLYSGDRRAHGRKPGMIRKLADVAAAKPLDALLMEGTHVGSESASELSEHELEERIVEQIKTAPALILASFSPLDVDRLVTFYRAARRTDRVFVVDAYAAFVLHLVAGQAKIPRPTAENGIRVYVNAAVRRDSLERIHRRFAAAHIRVAEVLESPAKFVMVFRPSMTALDFAGRLPAHCRVIYSRWPGYLDAPEWRDLQTALAAVEGDLVVAHASGHIRVSDLAAFVQAVNPRQVIPVHTFAPDRFSEFCSNVRRVEDGAAFEIA